MPDTFAITIVSIIIFTVVAAFIRGRTRDKCLRDFSNDPVTLEETSGKIIWGELSVVNTGLELIYTTRHKDKSGHDETSYILYKHEYSNIQALIRYHDELNEQKKKEREKELKRTYHPTALRRLERRIQNFFKTVRDSIMDIVNLLIGQAKRTTSVGAVLTSQDKYASKMKKELIGSMGTSFEPLLERHIGKRVVLELTKGDKIFEYPGVLKEYTSDFIEIMDVDYRIKEGKTVRKADLVVPRKYGVIRHLGE
ncbi:hypothetical protein CH333_00865 [candidate division WOR-3 bacterium JGI_Cruoil_03_44_89]|uniref:Uncharacterized protein n=1 Tax=candidate division WOR-3 bacterium JGI_Cruoil_03_44_89 TaxID=1973748 RepID=A0A235BZ37_UNCW3|nr:MAG: hypothetical protein CH333_00865 [candidate division WOR-3 bacterium JGI_Cruoil_03_44_89]